jgi:hypothetical protein
MQCLADQTSRALLMDTGQLKYRKIQEKPSSVTTAKLSGKIN